MLTYRQQMRARIRDLRENHRPKLSQGDMAHECGVTTDQWKKWEKRGEVPDQLKTIVCRKLGVSVEFFLDGFEEKVGQRLKRQGGRDLADRPRGVRTRKDSVASR